MTASVTGESGTPTGSVVLTSGSYKSASTTLASGSATILIPAGSLATGSDTLAVAYTPDTASSSTYTSATGSATVSVTTPKAGPTVTVTPDSTTLPYAQSLVVAVTASGSSGTPTGSVVLTSGSYTSAATTLSSGSATIYVLPGSLATGADTLTVTYTPDSSSSANYASSAGSAAVTVTSPGSTGVTVSIDTNSNRHPISEFIYGNNNETVSEISDVGYTYSRWGGNDASNYNYLLQTRNSAADWYFENYGGAGNQVQLIQQVQNAGSHALTTMATMDWVAGHSGQWSFPVKTYGAQCSTDPYNSDAGNGQKTDCQTAVTTQPATSAYYPLVDTASDCPSGSTNGSTCIDRKTWAQALASSFNTGTATCSVPYSTITSCHFYDLDNEPDIWNGTHRDVHPAPAGYDELANLYVKEATNLKTWDPAAVRFGPVFCCWWYYWNGANGSDKGAHGGVDFLPWWLNQVYWLDKINGARTLDVYDIHAYADAGPTSNFTNEQLRATTVRAAAFYWDPATLNGNTNNPWTTSEEPNPGIPFVIPRMKAMVNAIYPGTPLAFTEWGLGLAPNSSWDFSTAIADADTLGVFGREGLSFGSRWGGPSAGTAEYLAWKIFLNYDGLHHQFGSLSVSAQNNGNSNLFTSYAALDSAGSTLTIMVLNKDESNTANVTFNLNGFSASSYTAYTLASTASTVIKASSAQGWSAAQSFPPYSITLLVVSGSQTSKPASEWYLNPDDLMIAAGGTATLNPRIVSGTAPVTLTSVVLDAYEGASACSGSMTLSNATVTAAQSGTIKVNPGSTPGYCHFTVTGNDGTATQKQGGWIVVGNPPATLSITSGNNQLGSAGTALAQPLRVTLTPGKSGASATGAGILFTTTAGTLSNGTTTGASVIATTNSSGVASVTLTLPVSKATVTVTAQDQILIGGATVSFSETAN